MAISNPITVPEFQGKLGLTGDPWTLGERLEVNEMTTQGVVISQLGEGLWMSSAQTMPLRLDAGALQVEALMSLIKRGRKFLLIPTHQPHPFAYADGSNEQGSITLNSVSTDLQQVTFSGFDAGFQLTVGDYFSFVFGGKYYFHQVMETVQAASNGTVTDITVSPPISENVTPPTSTVIFDNPFLQAVYMPGSHSAQTYSGVMGSGFSFSWVQAI